MIPKQVVEINGIDVEVMEGKEGFYAQTHCYSCPMPSTMGSVVWYQEIELAMSVAIRSLNCHCKQWHGKKDPELSPYMVFIDNYYNLNKIEAR